MTVGVSMTIMKALLIVAFIGSVYAAPAIAVVRPYSTLEVVSTSPLLAQYI
jgi:hypothetical protein